MNPRTLRTGIGGRLRTITGLAVYERWPNQLNPPCAIVSIVAGEPEQAMGRGDLTRWDCEIDILQSLAAGWENAEDRLDPLLATSSTGGIYGVIAADRTLGAIAHSTFVTGIKDYGRRVIDEQLECLGVTVGLEVWAS